MASIKVPQESPSLALSSRESLLDLRQAEFSVHLRQKMPFRWPAWSCPAGDHMGRTTEQQGIKVSIADLARTRAVGCAVSGLRVPEGMFTQVNKGISAMKQGGPREKTEVC